MSEFCNNPPEDIENVYFITENTSDFCNPKNATIPHDHYANWFNDDIIFSINIGEVINSIQPNTISEEVVSEINEIAPFLCVKGGKHDFDPNMGGYLRSQYGGLTWQLICKKCGAKYDTGDHWD